MEWIVKRSSELYVRSSGLSKASDQFGYGCPFLSYKDVFLTRTSETTNELGMSCVVLKDYDNATFNGFTKCLRPLTDEIVPEYAAYFFRSAYFRAQCQSLASLITRASLNDGMIRCFKIKFPKEIKSTPYKAVEIDNLRSFVEKTLEQMIGKNISRVVFSQRYKNIIDRYNAGGSENEDLPDSYDRAIFNDKTNTLFNHFVDMAAQGYGWIA